MKREVFSFDAVAPARERGLKYGHSIIADRFVLTLINNRVINEKSFNNQENGSVLLNDDGRKTFFEAWQKRKQDVIMHPFLQEKIPWGLVPFVQAQLLARYIRGDIDEYPSYLWK